MIREATLADVPAIVAMGRALHEESPRYRRLPFNARKVEALARQRLTGTLTTSAPGGVFVAEKGGEVIGVIGGYVAPHFFSDDLVASDYTFYVKPEHRGGLTAARLVKAFEKWAIKQGASDIMPGVSTMIGTDTTVKLYERLGYEQYGLAMIKRIRNGN